MGNYPSINGRDFPNEVQDSLKIMVAELPTSLISMIKKEYKGLYPIKIGKSLPSVSESPPLLRD